MGSTNETAGESDPPKKRRNPLTASSVGGRVLSSSQLPWFLARPPRDYGVLETIGRNSGQRRRCCLRIVEHDKQAGIVAIGGRGVGWLANLTESPEVRIRTRQGWRSANARVVADFPEALRSKYHESNGLFCYGEYLMWRPGRPTAEGIRDLHRTWLDTGVLVLLDLAP
ncbi:MAG: nitroreductase family deazaflavin-dependent oxidoreductase [Actinomycetota bacterium]